jgi:Flp pilus assembly protein TadG
MAAPIPVSGSPASWLRGYLSRRGLGERGAVAVEFALIFPVFLFMILFMLDAGRYLTVQMALNNAADVGARALAISGNPTDTATLMRTDVPSSIVGLSTMDPTLSSLGVNVGEYICPINSENYSTIDLNTGLVVASPDGNCTDLGTQAYSSVNCGTVGANNRATAKVYVTFKWITPLGLLVSLAKPSEFGPKASIYFKRNATDTTIIEGKAKLLCQN